MNICSRIPPVTVVLQLTLACATALAVNEAELPKLFNVEVGGYNKDWNEYGKWSLYAKGSDIFFLRGHGSRRTDHMRDPASPIQRLGGPRLTNLPVKGPRSRSTSTRQLKGTARSLRR